MAKGRREALARRRRALGLSQEGLADKLSVDRKTVARWECGTSSPHPWQRPSLARALLLTLEELDQHLELDDLPETTEDLELTQSAWPAHSTGHPYHRLDVAEHHRESILGLDLRVSPEGDIVADIDRRTVLIATAAALAFLTKHPGDGTLIPAQPAAPADPAGFAGIISERWPGVEAVRAAAGVAGTDWHLLVPGGRNMPGTTARVRMHPARLVDGQAVLAPVESPHTSDFARRSDRGFIAGAVDEAQEPRIFLLDARAVRTRPAHELAIPASYELDDLTFGILWAVTNLDDALLSDDRSLHEARHDLQAYERLTASTVSRESAPGLNPIAHMYLGSEFCARYILRSLPDLHAAPVAWTKEQRGEEASTWLLFDHKYHYLRETVAMSGGSMRRGFCIPESAVAGSAPYERALLFLAIALMESLGIHVQLTTDASYETVEGFVLAPGQQEAIIANWVGGEGMWHVDLSGKASVISQFENVAGDVATDSIIEAAASVRRLEALADYLELDWRWLTRRCAEVGQSGTGRLVQSRSRLIAPTGVDAACRYVGSFEPMTV
jgi:transcriptional regulator with XRE-family HTH domain